MVATIHNLDTANLFVGDDDPANSQFLVLQSFTLPQFEEMTRSYNPGGGVLAISMGMRQLNALTFPFSLNGIQPEVMSYFMKPGSRRVNYTIRGNLADVSEQTDQPFVATINGRMTTLNKGQFSKASGVDTDYVVNEIVRYRLVIGTEEKFFFDAFLGPRGIRVDGVEVYTAVARNVGLL